MQDTKIIIVTCFHKRPQLSERWIRHTQPMGHIVAAVSDPENLALCRQYGIEHIWTENRPVGAKHNKAMELARGRGLPVMILPSDDFLHPAYLDACLSMGADYVFPASLGMYDESTGRACIMRWEPGASIRYGAGRFFSAKVLEAVPELWTPTRNRGLDTDSHSRILCSGFAPVTADVDGSVCLTDIKSGENIWDYDRATHGIPSVAPYLVLRHISP
jgi:hypothetical protein